MSHPCYNCKQKAAVILFEQQNGFRARVCRNCNHYATYSRCSHQKAETKTLKRLWRWYYLSEFCVSDPRAFMGDPVRPIDHAIALLEALSSFKAIAKLESSERIEALCDLAPRHRIKARQIRQLYECWMAIQADLAIYGEGES
jgi:hypothetical protein